MIVSQTHDFRRRIASREHLHWTLSVAALVAVPLAFPCVAQAQSGSPIQTGFTALQTLFTGTVAKVASRIATVIGGYQFAHGEPGAKKTQFASSPRLYHRPFPSL